MTRPKQAIAGPVVAAVVMLAMSCAGPEESATTGPAAAKTAEPHTPAVTAPVTPRGREIDPMTTIAPRQQTELRHWTEPDDGGDTGPTATPTVRAISTDGDEPDPTQPRPQNAGKPDPTEEQEGQNGTIGTYPREDPAPAGLTLEDMDCLADAKINIEDPELSGWLNDHATLRHANECLSEGGQAELFYRLYRDTGMNQDQLECLRRGLRPIEQADGRTDLSAQEFERARLAEEIMWDHCTMQEAAGMERDGIEFQMEMWSYSCMIDVTGGPEEFTRWMIADPLSVQDIAEALAGHGACGAPDPWEMVELQQTRSPSSP